MPNYCFSERAESSPAWRETPVLFVGVRLFGNDSRKNESCDRKQWLEMRPRTTLYKASLTSGKYHNIV